MNIKVNQNPQMKVGIDSSTIYIILGSYQKAWATIALNLEGGMGHKKLIVF
jgi:hypothetical protein